jgi:hypothetical protein
VDQLVVVTADEGEVVEVGRPSELPRDHVMGLREPLGPTAGKGAAIPITVLHEPPDVDRNGSAGPTDAHDSPIGIV